MAPRPFRWLDPACSWLLGRPSYMLLTADDDALAQQPPRRFRLAWIGLLFQSAAWALAMIGVWELATWVFPSDKSVAYMPAGLTVLLFAGWAFRRALACLVDTLADPGTGRAVLTTAMVCLLTMCMLRLRPHWYPVHPIWPEAKMYRVLLLMPLWGAWAMTITVQFCRPTRATEPAVAAFASGCGPVIPAAWMGAALVATIQYFSYLPWTQLSISAVAVASGVLGGPLLCRREGGLTRRALLASNALTQLAFLLACLANQS